MPSLTKQCWSCPTIIPYEEGWCEICEVLIPESVRFALGEVKGIEPYAGAMRLAVADVLRTSLAKRNRPKPAKPISLDDLEI